MKKLTFTMLYLLTVYILFLFPICYLWIHIDSAVRTFLKISIPENINYILCIIIANIFGLMAAYFFRLDNKKHKAAFKETQQNAPYSFIKDFITTLKSQDNIVHTVSYFTIDFLFTLITAVSPSTSFPAFITGTLMLLIQAGLFGILNTCVWCLVHKTWL